MTVHVERLDQSIDDTRGELARFGGAGMALHDRELVAAKPRHRVDAAHDSLQTLGHRA